MFRRLYSTVLLLLLPILVVLFCLAPVAAPRISRPLVAATGFFWPAASASVYLDPCRVSRGSRCRDTVDQAPAVPLSGLAGGRHDPDPNGRGSGAPQFRRQCGPLLHAAGYSRRHGPFDPTDSAASGGHHGNGTVAQSPRCLQATQYSRHHCQCPYFPAFSQGLSAPAALDSGNAEERDLGGGPKPDGCRSARPDGV